MAYNRDEEFIEEELSSTEPVMMSDEDIRQDEEFIEEELSSTKLIMMLDREIRRDEEFVEEKLSSTEPIMMLDGEIRRDEEFMEEKLSSTEPIMMLDGDIRRDEEFMEEKLSSTESIMMLDGDIRRDKEFMEERLSSIEPIIMLDGDIRRQMSRHSNSRIRFMDQYRYNKIRPDIVYNAHMDFLRAGSYFIRTNTFNAFLPYLQTVLNEDIDSCSKVIEQAAKIAKKAVEDYCEESNISSDKFCVIGSCGQIRNASYFGLKQSDLKDIYRHRMQILKNNGIDTFSLESIRSIKEAQVLQELMREFPGSRALMMFSLRYFDYKATLNVTPAILNCYNSFNSRIIAVGLNDLDDVNANDMLIKINSIRDPENIIPFVVCTKKCDTESPWKPVNVLTDNPALDWSEMGLRYIGGGDNVVSDDIMSVYNELNRT